MTRVPLTRLTAAGCTGCLNGPFVCSLQLHYVCYTLIFSPLKKKKKKLVPQKSQIIFQESGAELVAHKLSTSPENSVFNPVFDTMF